jgi:lipopolysaccharide/colanic/teichoic acid biosynthesis glycosyltransferase
MRTLALVQSGGILLLSAWIYALGIPPFRAENWGEALTLFAIHTGLAAGLDRLLALGPLGVGWRRRLAFLAAGAGPFFAAAAQLEIPGPGGVSPAALAASVAGAFCGALLVSCLEDGLWEDNAPPSPQIQAEIIQKHLETLGPPGKAPAAQRLLYPGLALIALVLAAPVSLSCIFLLWLEDPGPLFFVKNSTGRGGRNFRQLKFRTMIRGAETGTGPVMAGEQDGRVLVCGRFLRKSALDELPQLINILSGEMSFVGPRPQRTVLVHGYLERLPEYACRHAVLPGLAGLAQVAGDYYLTPRQKLRFDRLYIRYAGPGFDLKLLLLACLITFWFRWQKNWSGRLPRPLLHGTWRRKQIR